MIEPVFPAIRLYSSTGDPANRVLHVSGNSGAVMKFNFGNPTMLLEEARNKQAK